MLEKGGVSCSQPHTISPALRLWWRRLLSEFEIVSKTTKCRDFTVIFPVFFKNAP